MDNPFGLQRYGTADLESLMDRISRNSIGLDTYFENIFNVTNQVNYPPYNIVHVNNVESRLEIALAGFKKKEIKVYTEYGKLVVEGTKETKEEEENEEAIIRQSGLLVNFLGGFIGSVIGTLTILFLYMNEYLPLDLLKLK